jgi:hypothetical protein
LGDGNLNCCLALGSQSPFLDNFRIADHSSGILESAAAGTAFSVLQNRADSVGLSVDDNEIVPL